MTHIVHISLYELLSSGGIDVVQYLIKQDNFALELVQLGERLRAIIGFRVGVRTGQHLHEVLCGSEVSRRAPANKLLQLRRLRLAILRFQLIRGLEVLDLHHRTCSHQHHASHHCLAHPWGSLSDKCKEDSPMKTPPPKSLLVVYSCLGSDSP